MNLNPLKIMEMIEESKKTILYSEQAADQTIFPQRSMETVVTDSVEDGDLVLNYGVKVTVNVIEVVKKSKEPI